MVFYIMIEKRNALHLLTILNLLKKELVELAKFTH